MSVNTVDNLFRESEGGNSKRIRRKKDFNRKNTSKQNFKPFTPSENTSEEIQVTQVLNYSENDFPVLGCGFKTTKRNQNSETFSNSNSNLEDHKCLRKVLKSKKPKETFKLNFEDLISNLSNKPTSKHKTKSAKHHSEDVLLSGNPLDSDNPIRKKGVVSTKPKLKRISKTKSTVYDARTEMQQLKAISERIAIEGGQIHTSCDASVDELWKPLCLFKAKEIKEYLRKESSDKFEQPTVIIKSPSENDKYPVNGDNSIDSSDDELPRNHASFPLQSVLDNLPIPPYKLLIHNNNFKRYCDNLIISELDVITGKLIGQLVRYQYKKYQIDPIKAGAKKRYVLGLRQVKKYTKMNKVKLIVFVPNMEESLYDIVEELKSLAKAYSIPYLFALTRQKLGKIAYKKVGVSFLGILDYSGAEEHFKTCIEVLTKAKKLYAEKSDLAKTHYEQFGDIDLQDEHTTENLSEEINKDFISKLSLHDDTPDVNDTDENVE